MSRIECLFLPERSPSSPTPAPSMAVLSLRRGALALALMAVIAAPFGCTAEARPAPPPPLVTVATPVRQDVTPLEVFVGRTEAVRTVEIRARVQGYLEEQHFETGTDVEAGQVLFTIEQVQYEAALDRAKAVLESSRAELARAEADLKRVEQAVQTNAVSVQEVDLRRADRDKAEASLAAAEAAVTDADTQLSYTNVRSPIAGRVGREHVSLGNLVGSGENTLLTTVYSMKPLYVYLELPEVYVVDWLRENDPNQPIEKGEKPVWVALEGEQSFEHEGYIEFVENTVDSATGTILVRALLPNEDNRAYPGMFVRVQLENQRAMIENAILVEEVAIGTDLAGKYVLVVDSDGMVERRGIVLGPAVGQLRAVLEGLNPDDRYIVDGLMRARPGRPVQAETREEAAARAAAAQGQRG